MSQKDKKNERPAPPRCKPSKAEKGKERRYDNKPRRPRVTCDKGHYSFNEPNDLNCPLCGTPFRFQPECEEEAAKYPEFAAILANCKRLAEEMEQGTNAEEEELGDVDDFGLHTCPNGHYCLPVPSVGGRLRCSQCPNSTDDLIEPTMEIELALPEPLIPEKIGTSPEPEPEQNKAEDTPDRPHSPNWEELGKFEMLSDTEEEPSTSSLALPDADAQPSGPTTSTSIGDKRSISKTYVNSKYKADPRASTSTRPPEHARNPQFSPPTTPIRVPHGRRPSVFGQYAHAENPYLHITEEFESDEEGPPGGLRGLGRGRFRGRIFVTKTSQQPRNQHT